MDIKKLTFGEIKLIYETQMLRDFPADELKPFEWVSPLIKKDLYFGFGLFSGAHLDAYALFIKAENTSCVLLDYFAVSPKLRCSGVGSRFLSALQSKLDFSGAIIAEVENPDFAENNDQLCIRQRRIEFYKRSGFNLTDVRTCVDGVHFSIIALPLSDQSIDAANEVDKIYKTFMPEKFYTQKVTFDFSSN